MFSVAAMRKSGIVTSGLALHLDVRQSASYSGSGQDWNDLSGNGYNFFLGDDGTSANDPSYSAGPPAYFGYTGAADWNRQQAAYSGSIMRLIGRQNQAFTLEVGLYNPGITSQAYLASTSDGGVAQPGFGLEIGRTSNKLSVMMAANVRGTSTTAMSTGAWHTVGFRGIADGSNYNFLLDGAPDGTWAYNYSTFTTGDSTNQMRIGDSGRSAGGGSGLPTGARIMFVRAYTRALSDAEILRNYNIDANSY